MRIAEICIVPIRWYQRFLSPLHAPTCRFTPTCSQYAIDALGQYGLVVGLCKVAWRLMRCQPFHPGGYDPA